MAPHGTALAVRTWPAVSGAECPSLARQSQNLTDYKKNIEKILVDPSNWRVCENFIRHSGRSPSPLSLFGAVAVVVAGSCFGFGFGFSLSFHHTGASGEFPQELLLHLWVTAGLHLNQDHLVFKPTLRKSLRRSGHRSIAN